MKRFNRKALFTSVGALVLAVLFSPAIFAQGPPERPMFSPLRPLKVALADANAPELSDTQETALLALIKEFREARRDQDPDGSLLDLHRRYDNAVLTGNLDAARAAAAAIGVEVGKRTAERLQAEAAFQVAAWQVLTEEQQKALTLRIGTRGVTSLLQRLAGGPGRPGGPDGPPIGPPGNGQGNGPQPGQPAGPTRVPGRRIG